MIQALFQPFPSLSTERLKLRQLHLNDAPEIFIQRSDPAMLKYTEIKAAEDVQDARLFIEKINAGIVENASIYWAITLKDNPKLIGTICLWNLSLETETAELGFALNPDSQGKGYMGEALGAVLDYGFNTMKIGLLKAYSHPDNKASIRLLERNTFVLSTQSEGYSIYVMDKGMYQHFK